jgi:hypothetical protein
LTNPYIVYCIIAYLLYIVNGTGAREVEYNISMNKTELAWKERASELEAIDSVWTGVAAEVTPRAVLADPCISLILVKSKTSAEVILRGPETQPRGDILLPGYLDRHPLAARYTGKKFLHPRNDQQLPNIARRWQRPI